MTTTYYFIPLDEMEENEFVGHLGAEIAAHLADTLVPIPIWSILEGLCKAAETHEGLVPRPAPRIIQAYKQAALANGSLAATPLGCIKGIWIPLDWHPEPGPEAITVQAETWVESEFARREQNRTFEQKAHTYTAPRPSPAPIPSPQRRRYATPWDRFFLSRKPKPASA